jgi:hypothetical protein
MIFIGVPSFGRLGQQGDRARAPDGTRELPLVSRTASRDPSWRDLPALGDEALQPPDVLVVDETHLVDAELADLAAPEPAPLRWLRCWWNGSLLPCRLFSGS